MTSTVRSIRMLVGVTWTASRSQTILQIALSVLQALGVLQIVGIAWLIQAALDQDPRRAFRAALVIAVAIFGARLSAAVGLRVATSLQERTDCELDARLIGLVSQIPTLDVRESPEVADAVEAVRRERGALGQAVTAMYLAVELMVRAALTVYLRDN